MSVKIINRKDLQRNARRTGRTSKAQRIGSSATKILAVGDLVMYNGYDGWPYTSGIEAGTYGVIVRTESDGTVSVLCEKGVLRFAKQGIDRIQTARLKDY